ncbi:hypothetical protein FHL15_001047 [Xylaria flabelliformis]|uniref:Uncharacterized protein n=1 Tax=Xylaria flabelliformis TaxID=2512241 RepID=A0A553ICB1_9PEZI|nr:hypothetical protein FHL15_001047 [Xylaria flabelliformis]
MAQPQPQLLPQPDSAVISNNVTESGQNPIAASLIAINQTLQRLETRMDGLETRMERLETRTARLLNNAAVRETVLQPLYSPITNDVVQGFPRTKRDMNKLSDQPVQGTPDIKLRHLKIICGITTVPIDPIHVTTNTLLFKAVLSLTSSLQSITRNVVLTSTKIWLQEPA